MAFPLKELQAVINDPRATRNQRDAATEVLVTRHVSKHLADVLLTYVRRAQAVDRYGK